MGARRALRRVCPPAADSQWSRIWRRGGGSRCDGAAAPRWHHEPCWAKTQFLSDVSLWSDSFLESFFFPLQMNLTDFWIRTELRSFYMNYQREPKASRTLQLMLWQFRLKVFSLFCFIHFALSSSSLRLLLFVSNIKRPRSCDSDSQPCAWICSNFGSTRCFVVCCSADWTFVTSQADPGGCKHDFHLHAGVF